MIAAVFGPSGSDRRMYNLMALAGLLTPLGAAFTRLWLPGATMPVSIIIGGLLAALAVCLTIVLYGLGRMACRNLAQTTGCPDDASNTHHDDADIDTDLDAPARSLPV